MHCKSFTQLQPYEKIWADMKALTQARSDDTPDELWLLEHSPVFTQGLAGKPEHIIDPHDIPVIQSDRGGQVTYHGPGQLMIYTLFDLKRLGLNSRTFVVALENVIIRFLKTEWGVTAIGQREAPGVYVTNKKIASIGLRVKRHCSYHGLALNVDLNLTPFSYINPCGFKNLEMTQVREFAPQITLEDVKKAITPYFLEEFDGKSSKVWYS